MKYIVRLKPLSPFFFGGETTFNENLNGDDYFIHSNLLPQASTLIGVMRYVVLKVNDMLIKLEDEPGDRYKERKRLIGTGSFSISTKHDYGAIKSVSPVFVEDKRQRLLMPCPADFGYNVTFENETCVSGNKGGSKSLPRVSDKEGKLFPYKDYDNFKFWIDENGGQVPTDEIFADAEQIGITKGETRKDDKGFYKQTFKIFGTSNAHNYEFAFSADIDDEKLAILTVKSEYTDIVQMGGQRSMFRISISRADNQAVDLQDHFKANEAFLSTDQKVILLSDAYLPQGEWDKFDFVWGESICNRYVETTTDSCSGYGKPKKSAVRYGLLSRGSVIFHNDISKVKEALDKDIHLKKAGLNQYIIK